MTKQAEALQYQTEVGSAQRLATTNSSTRAKNIAASFIRKFRANRPCVDVETSENLWLKTIDGGEIDAEDEQ